MAGNKSKEEKRAQKSQRLRASVQRSIERQQQIQKENLLRQRLDLATQGVRFYESKRIADAVKNFHAYLKILEDWKKVPDGGLSPAHFNTKLDMGELLLISAIYWDLAKLYDRTRTAAKYKEFMHYLEKYVAFSKGMPYQALCAEAIRKYLRNDKALHKKEFRTAYLTLGGRDECFIATSLADVSDPRTLPLLRAFRDEVLEASRPGQLFVDWYYRNGAKLACLVSRFPRPLRRFLGRALDLTASRLGREITQE